MDEKIDIRQALRVFHIIRNNGKKQGNTYSFKNLSAISDFDGYTATLKDDYVCLDIFFHNKFSFQYSNAKDRELFLEKLSNIDKVPLS